MGTTVDYLVVGSGLTGGTVARLLADRGREVLILERRNHLGGNVHDFEHPSTIRVHTYGPHYFRCRSPEVWQFVQRFSDFYRYEAIVRSEVNGRFEAWPPGQALLTRFPAWQPAAVSEPASNFEEACLRKMPQRVYDDFVKGYTRRQWGMEPRLLSAELAARVRINQNHQVSLTPHYPVQVLPTLGYTQIMTNLTAGLPMVQGVDYLACRSEFRARKALVFTGSLDEFFDFDSGRLEYRSQRRVHRFLADCDYHQPCAQVNHPKADDTQPIRTLEWKHLLPVEQQGRIKGTVVTSEHPFTPESPDEFEYPVPRERNVELYSHYHSRAREIPRLVPCGRLGAYRYLDMDVAIREAMTVAQVLLSSPGDVRDAGVLPPPHTKSRRLAT